MSVLVTGSNGFVGRALTARLKETGEEVIGSVRRDPLSDEAVVGDLNETTEWSKALANRKIVVHTAGQVNQLHGNVLKSARGFYQVNTAGTLNLAQQAAELGVKRFVFISSIKAMGEQGHFHPDDVCHPQSPYGISKYEAELGLEKISRETGMETVILRLPMVYGPGVSANFLQLMKWVEQGLPLPFGMVRNERSLIGLRNLLDVIVTCMHHPLAANKVFLPSDGQPVSTPELARSIARAFGCEANLLPVPVSVLQWIATVLNKRPLAEKLLESLTVDSESLHHYLEWQPPWSLQDGLDETVTWYLKKVAV